MGVRDHVGEAAQAPAEALRREQGGAFGVKQPVQVDVEGPRPGATGVLLIRPQLPLGAQSPVQMTWATRRTGWPWTPGRGRGVSPENSGWPGPRPRRARWPRQEASGLESSDPGFPSQLCALPRQLPSPWGAGPAAAAGGRGGSTCCAVRTLWTRTWVRPARQQGAVASRGPRTEALGAGGAAGGLSVHGAQEQDGLARLAQAAPWARLRPTGKGGLG